MSEEERLIKRIKKLLRLADPKRGATPEEAAAAAAKAEELLFDHNLSMGKLGDLGGEGKPEQIEGYDISLSLSTYQTVKWHRALVWAISNPLFCRAVSWSGTSHMNVIGKKSNVEVVEYLYAYLAAEIEKMAVSYQRQWRHEWMRTHFGRVSPNESASVKISFCLGCVQTMASRINMMYRQKAQATSDSRALVVVSDKQLEEAKDRLHPHCRKEPGRHVEYGAMLDGQKAGHAIPISAGVGNGANQRREIGHG